MTPATARGDAAAARKVIATPCEKPAYTIAGGSGHSRVTASITAVTYAMLSAMASSRS